MDFFNIKNGSPIVQETYRYSGSQAFYVWFCYSTAQVPLRDRLHVLYTHTSVRLYYRLSKNYYAVYKYEEVEIEYKYFFRWQENTILFIHRVF